MLEQQILPDLVRKICTKITEEGEVASSASAAVSACRAQVDQVKRLLRAVLGKQSGDILTHKSRMCVAVAAAAIQSTKGVVLGWGAGGTVSFVEPSTAVPLNNRLEALLAELACAEEAVLMELTEDVLQELGALESLLATIAWLDVAVARHGYTEWLQGTLPEFVAFPWQPGGSPQAWLRLRALRHPLLLGWYLRKHAEWQRRHGTRSKRYDVHSGPSSAMSAAVDAAAPPPPKPVVPVDIVPPWQARAVVVTGPNTGGKTACLQALGLAVLLAKAGVGVPAKAPARLPHFSSVLADIGDTQSLSANLSTFSGHLARIQAAKFEADGQCLVLLDEVGTGTDPLGACMSSTSAKCSNPRMKGLPQCQADT
jgi:dsDNA-specific endonuclease/ATPase MutS2